MEKSTQNNTHNHKSMQENKQPRILTWFNRQLQPKFIRQLLGFMSVMLQTNYKYNNIFK